MVRRIFLELRDCEAHSQPVFSIVLAKVTVTVTAATTGLGRTGLGIKFLLRNLIYLREELLDEETLSNVTTKDDGTNLSPV